MNIVAKIALQPLILAALIAGGWFAYQNHAGFRELVGDIARYGGFIEQSAPTVISGKSPAAAPTKLPATAESSATAPKPSAAAADAGQIPLRVRALPPDRLPPPLWPGTTPPGAIDEHDAAREAWHEGRLADAIALYTELARRHPRHPDFAGELGNIYMAGGRTAEATDAYAEAVARLLRKNDVVRARQTLRTIYNLDPDRAAVLQRQYPPLR